MNKTSRATVILLLVFLLVGCSNAESLTVTEVNPAASEPFSSPFAPASVVASEQIAVEDIPNAFTFGPAAQRTISPNEVIEGKRSLVGRYQGTKSYNQYLSTDSAFLTFEAQKTYTVRFRYRILETPDQGFEVVFYSEKGASDNNWVQSKTFTGKVGDEGEFVMTSTLKDYEDYVVFWNIVSQGAIAIDEVSISEMGDPAPLVIEYFEEQDIIQGFIPFEIVDTKTFPLGEQGVVYTLRSINVKDFDRDGFAETAITITTYPGQLPQPVIILGAKEEITDLTRKLFPQGVPTVRHSPYIFFPDLDADGRTDILFADAGMDEEPYTGSKPAIALQKKDGTFTDISLQIPREFWETRSYATAAGDLDGDGLPEVLLPDQGIGKNTAAITWENCSFTVNRDWIPQELWSGSGQLAGHLNLLIEDIDEDGWQDVIVGGNSSSPNLRIVFGGSQGFTAENMLTLPDGVFGHLDWNAFEQGKLTAMQGAEIIGMLVEDFNNDGRKDIFLMQEQDIHYKPGAIADELVPGYQEIFDKGGRYFAQTAINVFMNQGSRRFVDAVPDDTPALGYRYYLSHVPIDLNGDGFLDIIGGYWSKFYANKVEEPLGGTTVFINDGTGNFRAVEGSKLFPTEGIVGVSSRQLGVFVPIHQTPDRLEGLFISSESDGKSGTLTVHKVVHEGSVDIRS